MRFFNSLIVPKNLKETLWDFLTFVLLQNIKTNWREDPLRTLKNFGKKVPHSAKKVRTFCFGRLVKKISA